MAKERFERPKRPEKPEHKQPERPGSTRPGSIRPGQRPVPQVDTSQPGAVTVGNLAIERQGSVYRGSMYAELQKFGSKTRRTLLDLEPEPIQVTGLDLTVSQDKALSAIQILLDRTGHEGNQPGRPAQAAGYRGQPVPRLAVSYSDFFEAYGLARAGDGQFKGKGREEALEALHDLAEQRWRIAYKRRRREGKKIVTDVIAPEGPVSLITLLKAYEGLEDEELERLERGEKLTGREKGLVVDCHPILIDQIATFGLLKPKDLHQEIQQLSPGKRVSRTVSLFIDWLLTLDMSTCQISQDNLLAKLRLDDLFFRQRQRGRALKQLQEAFEAALTLGYLLECRQEPTGLYVFVLDPARCRRVKQKQLQPAPGGDNGQP